MNCKRCGAEIHMMCQGGTGYCSQLCERIGAMALRMRNVGAETHQ